MSDDGRHIKGASLITLYCGSLSASGDFSAVFNCVLNVVCNLLAVSERNESSQFCFLILWVSHLPIRNFLSQFFDKFVMQRFFNQNSGAAKTYLSLVQERRASDSLDRRLKIAISENNCWIFSAQFKTQFF